MLNILSGVAVLLTTLAYGHLLHRYFVDSSAEASHNPVFWLSFAFGVAVGIFALVGGVMLLRRGR
jgi:F0F1-type ATP synthase membrane subunit c/vacuolar-type H+-ATPase subunit K